MAEKYFRKNTRIVSNEIITLSLHLTFDCNCNCSFCLVPYYKKNLKSDELKKNDWIRLIDQFCEKTSEVKKRRVKITGGEPLLLPYLSELLEYIKAKDSSIVIDITTNAFLLDDSFLSKSAKNLDKISISIDSFNNDTITKSKRTGMSKEIYYDRVKLVQSFGVPLRINTIVYRDNWQELMVDHIQNLQITSWKLIQVFDTIGHKSKYSITKEQFDSFINLNKQTKGKVFFDGNNASFDSIYYAFAPDGSMFNLDNRGVNIQRNI
jgi:MoaA/NifB/PqqE/SkfB family radical SAM enzyme